LPGTGSITLEPVKEDVRTVAIRSDGIGVAEQSDDPWVVVLKLTYHL